MIQIKSQKSSGDYIKITAEDNGKVVGRAYLYFLKNDLHEEPHGFLEDVFVEAEYRSHGIGTQLINRAIEEAKKLGCYKLVGNSRTSNEMAHKFYERLGFKKHGYEFRMDLK